MYGSKVLISQFVFISRVFCSSVSICSLIFWFVWPMVRHAFPPPKIEAGNLAIGMAIVPSESLCPSLGLKKANRGGVLRIVLKGH